MKVILDPRNRLQYASFYIVGIHELFGKRNTSYSIKPFLALDRLNEDNSFEQYMAFVLKDGNVSKKCIIDYRDTREIAMMAYQWCDVYAKINISLNQNMEELPKLVSIAPGYGLRAYSDFSLLYLCVLNYFKCKCKPLRGLYYHLCDYWSQYKYAKPLCVYEKPVEQIDNYVFHASTLWSHKGCANTTNPLRLAFIQTCKQNANINFEGGFFIGGGVKHQKNMNLMHFIPE